MARIALFIFAIVALAMIIPTWFLGTLEPTSNPAGTVQPPPPETTLVAPVTAAYNGRTVKLEMDPRGHFFGDFRLNGRRIRALVDTGATSVAINASTARQIGLSLPDSDFTHKVSTANGETRAAITTISSIEIGRIRIDNVQAIVLDDRALSDTLLGMSFLKTLARFDVSGDTLTLTQ